MKNIVPAIVASLIATSATHPVAHGAENDLRSLAMQWGGAVRAGEEKRLTGVVTHVSRLRDGVFVIADVQAPTAGVVAIAHGERPTEGDIVKAYGKIEPYLCRAAVRVDSWRKIADAEPLDAPVAKYHDFRSGVSTRGALRSSVSCGRSRRRRTEQRCSVLATGSPRRSSEFPPESTHRA